MIFKKIVSVLILLFISGQIKAQYWQERTTEQGFEKSGLYFKSHHLNTFGLHSFQKVAVGLIDDPFLNLQLNPANLPKLNGKDVFVYLDFRGDRTEAKVQSDYITPAYYAMSDYYIPRVDPRWFSKTREEKEPIFSLGILTYPFGKDSRKFFIGGTYQLIYNEEKFYQVPYWIYNSNYYYDSFGLKTEGVADIPIEDRFSGKDEMNTEGHLLSAFAGYNISDHLSIGLSLNAVMHDRSGVYSQDTKDEYSPSDKREWANSNSQNRNQDYSHFDFSGGLRYKLSQKFIVGAKAGFLDGEVDQDYTSSSKYIYVFNDPAIDSEWNNSFSNSSTKQNWNHNGDSKYAGINFTSLISKNKNISGYYKYTRSDVDLNNSSTINDTSFNSSRWVYNNNWSRHNGSSSTYDNRRGTGTRKNDIHEAMINSRWKVTDATTITIGIYTQSNSSRINSIDSPVSVSRFSEYSGANYNGNNYSNLFNQIEKKSLEWKYKSDYFTVQIPILMDFRVHKDFGIKLGINRILERWKIKDQSLAIFSRRYRNENTVITEENNFGERYTQPEEKITNDRTDIILGADLSVSKDFKINFLIDPEFEDLVRIAQWWLSFEASL